MLGTLVNCFTIIIGCLVGAMLKGKLSEKMSKTIMNGLALCVIYIGISGALKGQNTLIVILSMATGAVVGEMLDIDSRLKNLGDYFQNKLNKKNKINQVSISEGFVTSSLLFCVGAMAIIGSLESGISGNHDTLYVKSILDGISSIIFASTLGYGVILSAFTVLIYQGSITIFASQISGILTESIILNMTSVGSLLIMGLGFNMLKMTNIKIANLLPAVLFPIILSFITI